ncbi:hypothetical protein AVEN_208258-1, partial [Araneus ventricosus]
NFMVRVHFRFPNPPPCLQIANPIGFHIKRQAPDQFLLESAAAETEGKVRTFCNMAELSDLFILVLQTSTMRVHFRFPVTPPI